MGETDPLLSSLVGGLGLMLIVIPGIRVLWNHFNRPVHPTPRHRDTRHPAPPLS